MKRQRHDIDRSGSCIYCGNPFWHSRFWSKVDKENGPLWNGSRCWIWTAGRDNDEGYGRFGHPTLGVMNPHRVAYLLLKGEIQPGYHVDHLCRNPLCLNPEHLEAVPARVNMLRGTGQPARNAVKTHCLNGHLLAGANLKLAQVGKATVRKCMECARARMRKWFKEHPGYRNQWRKAHGGR